MRGWLAWIASVMMVAFCAPALHAQPDDASAIRQVLQRQVADWNRGDVAAFMRGYEDSPRTTFIGKTVEHGYAGILARYKKKYPTQATMGTLEFSHLEVRSLGADYAVVTGNFHLARSSAAGGEASGIFSLVWKKTAQGWKIILDHTS